MGGFRGGRGRLSRANGGEEAMGSGMATELEIDRVRAIEVFSELFNLLEDYGPIWYSEDLHQQAEAALRLLRDQPHNP
jgi:hypothetical protein